MRHEWFFLAFAAILIHGAHEGLANTAPVGGRLAPCPSSPNCVSSQSQDESQLVEPFTYKGTFSEAKERLIEVLRSMKRVRIVVSEGNYVHAEFTSALFRFLDDVEFLFDDPSKTIHVRSASRSGYYDFGVNRRRIESIRGAFQSSP